MVMKIEIERKKIQIQIANAVNHTAIKLESASAYCFEWRGHLLASVPMCPSQGGPIWSSIALVETGGFLVEPVPKDPAAMIFDFLSLSAGSQEYIYETILDAVAGRSTATGFDVNRAAQAKAKNLGRN